MSRIGKRPVIIPKGVAAKIEGEVVFVKGTGGELRLPVGKGRYPLVNVTLSDGSIGVTRISDTRQSRTEQGLVRALIQNMVTGVTAGFKQQLEIVGVGYRAEVKGKVLNLSVGYSHPVEFPIPDQIKIDVDKQTRLTVGGIDKQQVGEIAASIRRIRPPEPYKGKGIKYADEIIKRKVGKAAAGTTGG